MSIILTSPAFLLAIPALRVRVAPASSPVGYLAILLIALVNLMHFSQGWVQFGYRFSNDFVVFAVLLVAVGHAAAAAAIGLARASASSRYRSRSTSGASSGATSSDGERARPWPSIAGPPVGVAARVFVSNAWPGLMPGVGYWDTGEFQTVLPIMGTAHPTGYPTYVLLGLVGEHPPDTARRAGLPDNVLSLLCVAVAAGAHRASRPRLTGRRTLIAIAAGIGLALDAVVWRHATRPTRTRSTSPSSRCCSSCLCAGRAGPATVGPAAARSADRSWLVAAAVVFGLAVGQPLADPCCAAAGRALRRSRWSRASSVRPRMLAACTRGRCVVTVAGGLSGTAAPRRAVPRAARLRQPGDVGGVLVHRPGRAVPRLARGPPR